MHLALREKMAIERTDTPIHWNYFLALEEDLDRLARFIDLSGRNDESYSIEIARLFLGSSSEVDVVLKQLVYKLDPASNASTINTYRRTIARSLPVFFEFEATIPRFGLSFRPWSSWSDSAAPSWWRDHNLVKHHRHEHFEKANLKNCLNAVAGLYISVLYLYSERASNGELLQLPRLFNVADSHFGGTQMGRYGNSFKYRL
jgi:hypothetical protein